MIIKEYNFGRISLLLDGPNSQLSDLDFYDAIRKAVTRETVFEFDLG